MKRITIGIDEKHWKKMIQLKLKWNVRTFDDVLNYLLGDKKEAKKK